MTRLLPLLILLLLSTASLAADDLLQVTIEPFQRSEDGNTATALVVLRNKAGADITDIDVDLVLTSGGKPVVLTAANHPAWGQLWSCTGSGSQSVRCRLPFFRGGTDSVPGFWPFIPLVATIDAAKEGRFSLNARATGILGDATLTSTSTIGALYEREVSITSTADAGAGSLRAALEYANDACARDHVPCALKFRFAEPVPNQGWYTIRPLTPLPAITAPDLSIANTNGDPNVELDGSLLTTGHGLQLRGEGPATIDRLTIGGFPWDGIAITRSGGMQSDGVRIDRCAIGVHPDGQPNPNGGRGVTIDPPASDVSLRANQISANVRSGVFIAGGERIVLDFNTIGVHTFQTSYDPRLGNGASGVFAGPAARDVRISTNYIGGNAQMGVAVARGARGVRVDNTWIDSNRGLPIDHGLDSFSGYTQPSEFALPAPRLESVTYDEPTAMVTIRGTFDAPDPSTPWKLTLFGDGFGLWPERPLPQFEFTGATFAVTFSGPRPTTFRATVSSAEPSDWSTSEFSEAIATR
jgi:parallel beta helix pectate lyase-like protein